ncbi:hypothetical protein J3F84DRAFT_384133, partial [Trichoderma pleuroticola]
MLTTDDRRVNQTRPFTIATIHRHMTRYFFRIFPLLISLFVPGLTIFCFVKGRHDLIPTRFLLSYLHRTGVHSVICHFFFFPVVLLSFVLSPLFPAPNMLVHILYVRYAAFRLSF